MNTPPSVPPRRNDGLWGARPLGVIKRPGGFTGNGSVTIFRAANLRGKSEATFGVRRRGRSITGLGRGGSKGALWGGEWGPRGAASTRAEGVQVEAHNENLDYTAASSLGQKNLSSN